MSTDNKIRGDSRYTYLEIKARLMVLDSRENDICKERKELKEKLVEKFHPCQIGDVVEVKDYSFEGKKFKVTERWHNGSDYYRGEWGCSGPILKKDGTEGLNIGRRCE